jgi:hypothetical protein
VVVVVMVVAAAVVTVVVAAAAAVVCGMHGWNMRKANKSLIPKPVAKRTPGRHRHVTEENV